MLFLLKSPMYFWMTMTKKKQKNPVLFKKCFLPLDLFELIIAGKTMITGQTHHQTAKLSPVRFTAEAQSVMFKCCIIVYSFAFFLTYKPDCLKPLHDLSVHGLKPETLQLTRSVWPDTLPTSPEAPAAQVLPHLFSFLFLSVMIY